VDVVVGSSVRQLVPLIGSFMEIHVKSSHLFRVQVFQLQFFYIICYYIIYSIIFVYFHYHIAASSTLIIVTQQI